MFIQRKLAKKVDALCDLISRLEKSGLAEVGIKFNPEIKSIIQHYDLHPTRQEKFDVVVKIPRWTECPELYGEQFYEKYGYSYLLKSKYTKTKRPRATIKGKRNYYSTNLIIDCAKWWIGYLQEKLNWYKESLTNQIEELRCRLVWCK